MNPKFLTAEMGNDAIEATFHLLFTRNSSTRSLIVPKHPQLHIVILAPRMQMGDWPHGYRLEPHVLAEGSFGQEAWERDYCDIARCKAIQRWHGRSGEGVVGSPAHLLYEGDTPYWGTFEFQQVVGAASGIKPWHDRYAASIAVMTAITLAHDAWEKSEDKKNGVDFLAHNDSGETPTTPSPMRPQLAADIHGEG